MPSPVSAETATAPWRQCNAADAKIDLVGDQQRLSRRQRFGARGLSRLVGIENKETQFGGLGAGQRTAQPFLFDGVGGFAQPGGVGEHDRIAAEVDRHLDHVAGGAGNRRGDSRLALRQTIEQA
jgi:hypothetical protein